MKLTIVTPTFQLLDMMYWNVHRSRDKYAPDFEVETIIVDGGSDKYISCHHIIPRTFYCPRFDLENGIALCRACHILNRNSAHKDALGFAEWIKTRRDVDYLESIRHRQSKNDYQLIKLYLERSSASMEGVERPR